MWNKTRRPVGPCVILVWGIAGCADYSAQRHQVSAAYIGSTVTSSASDDLPPTGLDRAALVRAVLERNPTVAAARHALRSALAEPARVTALDPPTVEYTFAPLSIASSDVRFGHVIRLGQRIPWPGKLAAAGDAAMARAEASKFRVRQVELALATTAASLFDRHGAVTRALALNREHEALAIEIKAAAQAQYTAGKAPQQDVLQAEVALSHVLHQRAVLTSRRAILRARINGLLRRPPHLPLSLRLPSREVDLSLPSGTEVLQAEAVARRPELRAARAVIDGNAASIDLANRGYFPDFRIVTSYNTMWAQPAHRWMAGVGLDLPFFQLSARSAGVDAAEAQLSASAADLQRLEDEVRVEVESARQRVVEALHVVRLYRERLLVAARAQVDAASVGYTTGQNGFQALAAAERAVRDLEIEFEYAVATASERSAALASTIGRMPVLETTGEER